MPSIRTLKCAPTSNSLVQLGLATDVLLNLAGRSQVNQNSIRALSLFLVGMATGAAATFLLAPQSGGTTRRLIGRKFRDGERWTKDKVAAAKGHVCAHDEEILRGVEQGPAAKQTAAV